VSTPKTWLDGQEVVASTSCGTPSIKRTSIMLLRTVFNTALGEQLLDSNLAKVIKLPAKTPKSIEPFTI
jgi:hypothetical protein